VPGNQWLTWSAASLTRGNASELCDCYRPNGGRSPPDQWFENRFFRQRSAYGVIRVTFLFSVEDEVRFNKGFPPYGYYGRACKAGSRHMAVKRGAKSPGRSTRSAANATPPARDAFAPSEPAGCGKKKHVFNTTDAISKVVPLLNATHLFAQTGWLQKDIGCALAELEQRHGIKGFYMTHPNALLSPTPALGCGLGASRILDRVVAAPYPLTWFWDKLHALSILNRHFNELLLRAVASSFNAKVA